MKFPLKELIIAIIFGFIIGLIITYGIWTANQVIKQKEQSLSPVPTKALPLSETKLSQKTTDNNEFKLNLAQPEVHTLSNAENLIVSGTTQAFANVLIYAEQDHQILVANEQGQFSTEIKLIQGINYLTVTAINDTGQQASLDRTVIYSTTEIE